MAVPKKSALTQAAKINKDSTQSDQVTLDVADDVLISELLTKESNSVLWWAVIASVIFHLCLLAIKFSDPKALEDLFTRKSLEVVLLNARTEDIPAQAQVMAQYNSAGGGESDNNDYARASQAYDAVFSSGDSFEKMAAQVGAEAQNNMRMLQVLKESYGRMPPIDPTLGKDDPRRIAEEEKRKHISDRIAAIEQIVQETNARPRRMYIAPSAKRDDQALYFDAIRRKIEQKGTETFPRVSGRLLYGRLKIELVVNARGEFISARVMEGSGNTILDNQSLAIAREAGPFKAAPAELLKAERNVEFVFHMRFNFLDKGHLEVELMKR